jgi:enterochelin esterase-like enzyme
VLRATLATSACWMVLAFASAAAPPEGFDKERQVSHGKVQTLTYLSKTLGFGRPVVVYLPPNYKPENKYPVLYLLHGSGDDHLGWNAKGSANHILDNLYAEPGSKIVPMIVVMPYGFGKKLEDPMPKEPEERGKMSRAFDRDLIDDLIPFVESKFHVVADSQHRAVAGLSMGGSQSLRGGLLHLDLFSYLGCFSSMLREPIPEPLAKVLDNPSAVNARLKLFYLGSGDKDKGFELIQKFHQILESKHVAHRWEVKSGAHEWKVWKENIHEFAPLLFQE